MKRLDDLVWTFSDVSDAANNDHVRVEQQERLIADRDKMYEEFKRDLTTLLRACMKILLADGDAPFDVYKDYLDTLRDAVALFEE